MRAFELLGFWMRWGGWVCRSSVCHSICPFCFFGGYVSTRCVNVLWGGLKEGCVCSVYKPFVHLRIHRTHHLPSDLSSFHQIGPIHDTLSPKPSPKTKRHRQKYPIISTVLSPPTQTHPPSFQQCPAGSVPAPKPPRRTRPSRSNTKS